MQIYKYGGNFVIEAICDIAQTSLDTGMIPSFLKVGWVTPIWKGKEIEDPTNYRPISLTNHLIKIIERIVREKVTSFLEDNNLIEDTQHGSRNGRGTVTQLLKQHYTIL